MVGKGGFEPAQPFESKGPNKDLTGSPRPDRGASARDQVARSFPAIASNHPPAIASPGVVEGALAAALTAAAAAGQWEVVAQLARELEARRKALAAPNVIALRPGRDAER